MSFVCFEFRGARWFALSGEGIRNVVVTSIIHRFKINALELLVGRVEHIEVFGTLGFS